MGLGNPGPEYVGTRHNIGFEIVDRLAGLYDTKFEGNRKKLLTAVVQLGEGRIVLAKPCTFMNLSGQVIQALMNKAGLSPAALLVVHDDLDLPLGRLRLAPGASSGGHKGVQSIIDALGTADFARCRIGIGRPLGDAADYVLSRFYPEERETVQLVVESAVSAVDCVLREGLDQAMNKFNRRR